MQPVIYFLGPTASGKTGLSVELAARFSGEIVSGDSMQIYRDMHIASAAPDPEETQAVPHHLFEFLSPEEPFSVARYVKAADAAIADIHGRGNLPFVVGGTGLYLSALSQHIVFDEEPADTEHRRALYAQAEQIGLPALYQRLTEVDPATAQKVSPNDKKRILRALEIYETSGRTKSERDTHSKEGGPIYRNLLIGLRYRDRALLYDRINRRVDLMLERGLLDEAKAAFGRPTATAAQAIGHKEFFAFFSGDATIEEATERLKMQTRRYAKRQMTWFSKMEQVKWIYMDEDPDPVATATAWIEEFLNLSKRGFIALP